MKEGRFERAFKAKEKQKDIAQYREQDIDNFVVGDIVENDHQRSIQHNGNYP